LLRVADPGHKNSGEPAAPAKGKRHNSWHHAARPARRRGLARRFAGTKLEAAMSAPGVRFVLRDLPLASRVVLAVFLIATGLGYIAALVQLHFRTASPGEALPGVADVEATYFGPRAQPVSWVERLLVAESGPLDGTGSMRPAFTTASDRWQALTKNKTPEQMDRLHAQREGERLALLCWVRSGADRLAYDNDDYRLAYDLTRREITPEFLVRDGSSHEPTHPRRIRIRTLVTTRCVTCHAEDGRHEIARHVPLDTYEHLQQYCRVRVARKEHSVPQLAQTTHVHLLGFAVLYGAVGLVFTFSSYSGWTRGLLGPFPLVLQVVNIGCWWLARTDPRFAWLIASTGVLTALALAAQIMGTLFDLFGRTGKAILLVLLAGFGIAAVLVNNGAIGPYLDQERMDALINNP
jgi:hypothetical protein